MRLLLSGLIASMVLSAVPTQAQQVTNTQVKALVEALRLAAPKTGKQNDRLYSEWQVTPGIIPNWSKKCIGRELTPTQFEANAVAARNVVTCTTRRELQKQYPVSGNKESVAVRYFTCWWMTGNYTGCSSGPTAAYVQRVIRFYRQVGSKRPVAVKPGQTSPQN